MSTNNSSDAWHFPCNRKINAQNINIVQFCRLIFQGILQVGGGFFKGDSYHPYLAPSPKPPLMRSSRHTTPHVAKNSIVYDATDACSLGCIFSTILADSSASLGCPYFYLIQSNGWKSLCLLTGLSVQDYCKLLLQSKLVRVRNNKDGSRSIKVDRDEQNLLLRRFQLRGDIYGKGGRVELTDWYIKHAAIKRTMEGGLIIPQQTKSLWGYVCWEWVHLLLVKLLHQILQSLEKMMSHHESINKWGGQSWTWQLT